MTAGTTRVRERREARGMSQVALAAAARLSRQSIGAIEAGRTLPAVDVALRLAAALECRVEDLFGEATPDSGELITEATSDVRSERSALAYLGGRWVSHPLLEGDGLRVSADALARGRGGPRRAVAPTRPVATLRDNVVVLGCAPALGLLADRLNTSAGAGRFLWFTRSSTGALEALAARHTHVAGVHLSDPSTGATSVDDVRRFVRRTPVVMIALARWEAGLVTSTEGALRVRRPRDLGRRGVRVAMREPGSGARRLMERELARSGVSSAVVARTAFEVRSHLDVARTVSIGAAHVGVATRDAALAYGLDFIPLAEERYDLVLARDDLGDPRLTRLFETMTSGAFRREIAALGYDGQCAGERVAELESA